MSVPSLFASVTAEPPGPGPGPGSLPSPSRGPARRPAWGRASSGPPMSESDWHWHHSRLRCVLRTRIEAYAARSRVCILAWIHSASKRSLLYSSLFTGGSILRLNQCLSIAVTTWSASKVPSQALHGSSAVSDLPVLCSIWCSPGQKALLAFVSSPLCNISTKRISTVVLPNKG